MIKLFTLFIAFNLSSLNFVQASEVLQTTDLQAPEISQPIKTEIKASVWKISSRLANGTGFFIKPNLFVTNFHVIDGLLKTENLNEIYLSQKGNPNTLHIKKVIALSVLYDLALLESKENSPHYLTLSENELKINDEFFSIGYPAGVFTRINKTGSINYKDSYSFSFPINKSNFFGASGSPVLNKQREVVGFLHGGYKSLASAIKVNHLKSLIAGNIGQSCKNLIFKVCLEKEIENLKISALTIQENPTTQFQLAWMYHFGIGVKQNDLLSEYWLLKAAEQGSIQAQEAIEELYEEK